MTTPEPRPRPRVRLRVRGAVQGVGFRPFVYRLARELGLSGFVCNTPGGVIIEAQGSPERVAELARRLSSDAPPHARIHDIEEQPLAAVAAEPGFAIRHSQDQGAGASALLLPDLAMCAACLADIQDPTSRRHGYAFTTCTHCGPRYSILRGLPYDRPATTMAGFAMCALCQAEYRDPADRRFHAQTNACPACGPRLALWDPAGREQARDDLAFERAVRMLRRGAIVAVKGLGGFHLMVHAGDPDAVARLRARKRRPDKPLAVLFATLDHARARCHIDSAEAALLTSPAAPIVLVRRREPAAGQVSALAPGIAPGNPHVGALLAYTPLHYLLARGMDAPLVATSGNLSGEPLCIDEHQAVQRLAGIADAYLVHDRPIARPVDDSVARVMAGEPMVVRSARGYAPLYLDLPAPAEPAASIWAMGGHMKSAVAMTYGRHIVLGPHIGDLDTAESALALDRATRDLRALHHTGAPRVVACDAHPDYRSTRAAHALAASAGSDLHPVQHHHAHVLACMAEHRLAGPVLGVAWDGTGHGADGTVWGGELLHVHRDHSYRRVAHLRPFSLPGGDAAAREPRRSALGVLFELHDRSPQAMAQAADLPPMAAFTAGERRLLLAALERGVNAPRTSSAGRLFDAVAALVGLAQRCTFEGQAAMALEHAIDQRVTDAYPVSIHTASGSAPARASDAAVDIADWAPALHALIADVRAAAPVAAIAARFHNALVRLLVELAERAAGRAGTRAVVLTGGCFQNRCLTERALERLIAAGLDPYIHHRVPPNDGGLAVGQILATLPSMNKEPAHVPGRPRQDHRAHR